MNRLALVVILLAAGCQSTDARLAKESADLKAQQIEIADYIQSLLRERDWLRNRIEDLRRDLDRANGRKTF